MSDEKLTRQQLYDRIRQTSKEEFILTEMQKLGFWKANEGEPSLPEQIIKREGEVNRELNDLLSKQYKFNNREAMLKEMRKKRMDDAKKRREETKKRNEEKRQARAEAWAAEKEKTVVYLGEGVSGGLNDTTSKPDLLEKYGLPNFADALALANAMSITLPELRFLSYSRKISTVSHYKRFYVAKKSGGKRTISAPMPRLKNAQYWILHHILYKIAPTESAHGFVPKRSILTNATNHIGKDIVINLDLKDFFPSISYKRVKGLFAKIGYSSQIATILGLICTESDVDIIEMDGKTYYAAKGERFLPQGAPTSPAITNLICHRLDRRFQQMAAAFGFEYTRYADDLTFSADREGAKKAGQILWAVAKVVEDEGFTLHPDKIHVMRKGSRQEVTGIVVNEKLSIERDELRKFRALLHQIETTGIKGKTWGTGNIANTMKGYANFVAMVKPELGAKLKAQVKAILANNANKEYLIALSTVQKEEETSTVQAQEPIIEALPEKENEWWNIFD